MKIEIGMCTEKNTIIKVLGLRCFLSFYRSISHQAEDIFFHKYISSLFPL